MIPLGSVVFAVAALFFAVAHSALWEAFVTIGIGGLGVGFTTGAMPGFIVRAVPRSETGSAMGFFQVVFNVGLTVGSALALFSTEADSASALGQALFVHVTVAKHPGGHYDVRRARVEPALGVIRANAAANVHAAGKCAQCRARRLFIAGAEHDDVAAFEAVAPVEFGEP